MNIADKMEREAVLKSNLAEWMMQHGTIIFDQSRSNEYVGVRIVELLWKNKKWRVIEVDGMTCRIERI